MLILIFTAGFALIGLGMAGSLGAGTGLLFGFVVGVVLSDWLER